MFDKFYDEQERAKVRFVGFSTEDVRYDFGIVYTTMFFGKPLVICMQTGKAHLLDKEDVSNIPHLQQIFQLNSEEEAQQLSDFFMDVVPHIPLHMQYE
ncbi:MAG: DUF3055 domain-containing protein [Bacilli bacterium]